MAVRKTQKGGYIKSRLPLIILVVVLIFAVVILIQKTAWFDQAASPVIQENTITNLNSSNEIIDANNPDGTMGPATWYGNASNSLPVNQKGSLSFRIIDPPQGSKKFDNPKNQGNKPTGAIVEPTSTISSPTQSIVSTSPSVVHKNGVQKNGPQDVTALNLTVTKVEVHMAYQGIPKNDKVKPIVSPSPEAEKKVNHWETLNISSPFTVDLVSLAKSKDFAKLGITQLAAGRYTEVRLYVSHATANLMDGTNVPLTILGRDNIVRVVRPFTISAGLTTSLTMDIDAKHSVIKAGGQYLLKPVVSRLIEEKQ